MMKFWEGARRPQDRHAEAVTVSAGAESRKNNFMSEARDSVRGALLLAVSMILLSFNLLEGRRDSRS